MTADNDSGWITGERLNSDAMRLRRGVIWGAGGPSPLKEKDKKKKKEKKKKEKEKRKKEKKERREL